MSDQNNPITSGQQPQRLTTTIEPSTDQDEEDLLHFTAAWDIPSLDLSEFFFEPIPPLPPPPLPRDPENPLSQKSKSHHLFTEMDHQLDLCYRGLSTFLARSEGPDVSVLLTSNLGVGYGTLSTAGISNHQLQITSTSDSTDAPILVMIENSEKFESEKSQNENRLRCALFLIEKSRLKVDLLDGIHTTVHHWLERCDWARFYSELPELAEDEPEYSFGLKISIFQEFKLQSRYRFHQELIQLLMQCRALFLNNNQQNSNIPIEKEFLLEYSKMLKKSRSRFATLVEELFTDFQNLNFPSTQQPLSNSLKQLKCSSADTKPHGFHPRPPLTNRQLITKALESVPERRLRIEQIFDYLIRHYPYFEDQDLLEEALRAGPFKDTEDDDDPDPDHHQDDDAKSKPNKPKNWRSSIGECLANYFQGDAQLTWGFKPGRDPNRVQKGWIRL